MSESTLWPASAKSNDIAFPSFSDAEVDDFHEDVSEEEKKYYKKKFEDLNAVVKYRLHCTSCDRHLGDSIRNEHQIKCHPMLLTLICRPCYNFYNSGEFHRGEDGSELYCRWCGQGGQVYCCSECIHVFCAKCIKRNMGICKIREIEFIDDWKCFKCSPRCLWEARALCWALLKYFALRIKFISEIKDLKMKDEYNKMSSEDHTECCKDKRRKIRKKETASSNSKELLAIQDKNNTPINKNDSNKTRRQKRTLSPKEISPNITSQKSRRVTQPVVKLLSTREKDADSDDNTKSKTQMRTPSILRKTPRKREPGNVIQMTDNDVSINKLTGGLKFRIDPQNLSPKELYRLPDGRIFSINRNQNLPGGYSASILSSGYNTNEVQKGTPIRDKPMLLLSVNPPPLVKATKKSSTNTQEKNRTCSDLRKCDLEVPIEWFRYNLVDAISSLEETLARLKHLNKQTKSSFYLRSRSISEMRDLHKSFDGALNGSASKCKKVHEKLMEGFKFYLRKKTDQILDSDDDDDAVEILANKDSTIFIDENSMDSVKDTAKELHVNGTEEIDNSDVLLDGTHFDIEDENNPINTSSPNKDDTDIPSTIVSKVNKPDNIDEDVNGEEVERENVLVSNEISGDDPVPNSSNSPSTEDTVTSKTPANLDTKNGELLNTKDDKKGDVTVDRNVSNSATIVDTSDNMIDDLLNDDNIIETRIITDSVDSDF